MPANSDNLKTRLSKKARKGKRKANTPLSGEDSHCSETGLAAQQSSCTGKASTSRAANTSATYVNIPWSDCLSFQNSQEYVSSIMNPNNISPVAMNFGQPNFGQPHFFMSTHQTPAGQQNITPNWALSIMEDVKAIKTSSRKIEKNIKHYEF